MKTRDMTKGDPVRLIVAFAVPLFIGNIFQQIYNIADTMVAGYNLGDSAIAAIGATGTLYSVLVNFAWGMNSGFGIIIARTFGAKDQDSLKRSIAASLVLNTLITLALSVPALIFLRPLLHTLNVPAGIFEDAYGYISVIIGGMLATILYNMCSGILRAVGNSRTPLYFLIFSNLLNLALDCLFIIGMRRGVSSAAAATVISEAVSAIVSGIYILRRYHEILPKAKHFRPDRALLREMLTTGLAMAMMVCVVDLGSVLYQRAINLLGDTLIVAHTAARKLIGLFMLPLSSLASANSTFVSQNRGANEYRRIADALRAVMIAECSWAVFSCAVIWLFGGTFVKLLINTSDPAVIENAVLSVRIHFVFYPALGVLLALRTAMQALGEKVSPVVSSGFELGIKVLAAFVLIPAYGYIWVCLTEPVIWTVCVLFLTGVCVIKQKKRKEVRQ